MKSLTLFLLAFSGLGSAQIKPPEAKRIPVIDTYHGVKVEDPYRWLENQKSPETRKWIDGENRFTDAILKSQPSRPYLKRKLTQMEKIESVSPPIERGGRFFYSKKRPRDEQGILYYRDGLAGEEHVFLDPNRMSRDHTVTASYADFSDDGRYAAYQIRHGGADETVVHILDIKTNRELPDTLPLA